MSRFITLKIDLAELPSLVEKSAKTCLNAHGIDLPIGLFREIGNNVAGSLALCYDAETSEERLELWAHIVSEHCNMAPPGSLMAMLDYHDHEHEGPGTIRNHDHASRHYSLRKLAEVLSELEPEDEAP